MILIREAIPNDAGELAELITELGYSVEARELWLRMEKMPATLYRTLVALSETKVVGFIGLLTLPVYEHAQPVGWILALCVASDNRGKGIGKALLSEAEKHYRSAGVLDIRLHSGLQRDEAHQFYEKLGFGKSGYRFKKKLV
jgi:ribosomal protein S18 acetylase RimI-like enzyme